jgi:hypothetical protein
MRGWDYNIKMILRKIDECGLDSSCLGCRPLVVFVDIVVNLFVL